MDDDKRAERLALAQRLADAGITDQQAVDAIDGYQQAAVFTAVDDEGQSLDGLGLSWSEAAQDQIRKDVVDFITTNADLCRQFLEVTHFPWLQVGIDFSLTRNGHGAGFWDRGAGAVGTLLTSAAHEHGSQRTYVGESGELEVE